MLEKHKKITGVKSMLTPFVEENKVLLVHGESGVGKTIFIIKHLNDNNIKPLLLDLDDNEEEELAALNCNCDMIDGYSLIGQDSTAEELAALKGKVLIIDTWYKFHTEAGSEAKAYKDIEKMTALGITVIVLAHTIPYSGKEDKPEMADEIYRHIKGRLYIRKTTLKTMVEYHLLVEKIRGYKGDKLVFIRRDMSKEAKLKQAADKKKENEKKGK